jgi:hypothetical protein
MTEKKHPTLAEIKASHAPKIEYERYLLASRFVFRPPSFPAIWILVRLGITGETASWLSGLSAMAGFACLLWPSGSLLWQGLIFLILFNFFDCLDGGIARITNARNSYGRFLDSIMYWADMLFWLILGVTVWRTSALRITGNEMGLLPGIWLTLGALCFFLTDYAAYLDNTFDQALKAPWEKLMASKGGAPASTPTAGKAWPEVLLRSFVHNMRVRETHYLLLIPAFAFGMGDLFLAVMLAFNAALVPALLFVYCRRGRKVREAELSAR